MLSLGAGQGGTGEVGEGVASGPPRLAGRHLIHDPGINIKLKISQWEGRSQLDGGQCRADKRHGVPVSRTLSGDVLGNEVVHDHRTCGSLRKAGLAKTKSLGLDFREDQEKEVCSGLSDEDQCHSPPLVLDVPELMLPPGNFYTSRGFWHMLEGNHLSKNRGSPPQSPTTEIKLRDTDPVTPPPKPQRTFQYSAPKRWHQGENWASSASDSRLKCQVSQLPPGRISKNRKNRKSFEFEDVVQLTAQQGAVIDECQRSGIYHALSEDNIYEDIMPENQYEDVKLLEVCLPIGRPTQRHTSWTSQLPPKPHVLQVSSEKSGKGKRTNKKGPAAMHTPTSVVTVPKQALPKHHPKPRPRSRYVNKIQEIFNIKRGWKRVKTQGSSGYDGSAREETSGTDSDPEDSSTGRQRQCVYVHSTWRRRPSYSTLERERQLFQLFAVVSLRRNSPGNAYRPEITQQFPNKFEKSSRQSREAEERLKAIPKFCFPDSQDWRPCGELPSETFSFVLTSEDGSRWFGYCRKIVPSGKGKRLPEVHCIVSRLGCFNLFAKVLEEVERRREVSPALVQPFMRSLMEAPFPGPGCTITVKSFLPGSGNEVLTLCRPVDSRLEHVHFQSLLQCLSVGHLLQVFASLLLERRVIFIADKLSTLSHCAHAVLALLYPFTWQHTFVPVLPASMLDICCSPTPFLIGLLLPSLPQLLELPIEEVLIVDLCTDKFVTQVGDEDCILPNKLQVALHHILEYRETIMGQEDSISGADEELGLNSLMSEAFVHFFVELVGHYLLHMGEAAGGTQELKRDAFRKSHPSRGARQFLQLFMETQMFASFVQDRELRKGSVKGLFEVRAEEHLHSNPPPEPGGVNRFLKGLGNKMKFLQKK